MDSDISAQNTPTILSSFWRANIWKTKTKSQYKLDQNQKATNALSIRENDCFKMKNISSLLNIKHKS